MKQAFGDSGRHRPVMLSEVLHALDPKDGEIYLDGTFGAGGYTRAILDAADCRVIALDRDPEAIAAGREMERQFGGRLTLCESRFSRLDEAAEALALLDGVALDIGVSSMQLDRAERGFSFQADGPLDMRMGASEESAADVVADRSEGELRDIIRTLGEEPRAKRIARFIVTARDQAAITTTGQLAGIVVDAVGHRRSKSGRMIHPATRTFQALRIYVNDELGELTRGLEAAERALAPEGRLCVVSFHSLEDRIVKTFLAGRSGNMPAGSRHRPPVGKGPPATFTLPKKRAISPSDSEIATNPRARSARLRVAVRTSAPAFDAGRGEQ